MLIKSFKTSGGALVTDTAPNGVATCHPGFIRKVCVGVRCRAWERRVHRDQNRLRSTTNADHSKASDGVCSHGLYSLFSLGSFCCTKTQAFLCSPGSTSRWSKNSLATACPLVTMRCHSRVFFLLKGKSLNESHDIYMSISPPLNRLCFILPVSTLWDPETQWDRSRWSHKNFMEQDQLGSEPLDIQGRYQ